MAIEVIAAFGWHFLLVSCWHCW